MDEQVWNAYGERIKSLGPAQYGQVRDRHITWRRERGLYDRSIAGLIDDYRLHLAWLRHPLLALEGRYQRADGAEMTIEIDLAAATAPPAVVAIGRAGALQWLPPRAGLPPNAVEPDEGAGSPRESVTVDHVRYCALRVQFHRHAARPHPGLRTGSALRKRCRADHRVGPLWRQLCRQLYAGGARAPLAADAPRCGRRELALRVLRMHQPQYRPIAFFSDENRAVRRDGEAPPASPVGARRRHLYSLIPAPSPRRQACRAWSILGAGAMPVLR